MTSVSQIALDRLEQLLNRAASLGIGGRINLDFAMLRDLEYYTGFVFEGYIEEIGFSLCGGGRYDNLLPRFGYDVPAVGWMGGVERILDRARTPRHVTSTASDRASTCWWRARISSPHASARRETSCVAPPRDLSDEALIADARAHGIPRIVIAGTANP